MPYRILLCLLPIFFQPITALGQDQGLVDSLQAQLTENPDTAHLEIYASLVNEYLYTDHEEARRYIDDYIAIAEQYGNPSHIGFGTNMLGVYHNITSNYNNEGIKKARYRLQKRLGIETSESLDAFVMGLF